MITSSDTPKGETPRTDSFDANQRDSGLKCEKRLSIALDLARDLERELTRLQKENDYLRASLANSGGPCAYCKLPKEKWAECDRGFPGCARGDDAMLCPHVGADIDAREELARALRVVEAARRYANFRDTHAGSHLIWCVAEWEAGR